MPCRLPSPVASGARSFDNTYATPLPSLPPEFNQFDALLPALNLQQFSAQPVEARQRLSSAAAHEMYAASLSAVQHTIAHNWEQDTVRRREKNMQELSAWLSVLPSSWDKTLMTCTPADVLAFMQSHWLLQHQGSYLPDGSSFASPSGVNQCFSSLSTGFTMLGRVGSWDLQQQRGNPVLSPSVAQYRRGYKLEAWRSGYLEGSAIPMTEAKMCQLVSYIDGCTASNTKAIDRLCLERDALMILLMWESCLRGDNIGRVTTVDFFTADGRPLFASPILDFPTGSSIQLVVNGTKTVQGDRAGPIFLTASDPPQFSFVHRLPSYIHHRLCSTTWKFLFSPLAADRASFKDSPYSSSALGKTVRKHLEAAGLYAGESSHGFRRGRMQASVAQGLSKEAVGEQAMIKTASVVAKYVSTTRHHPRLERHQRSLGGLSSQ